MTENHSENSGSTSTLTSEVAANLSGELTQLKADFSRLKDDLRRLVDDSLSVARAGTGTAKDSLQGRIADVQERGNEAVKSIEELIEEKPLASIAVAVGVGFLLGKLLD